MTEIIILGVLTIWTITKIKAWILMIDIMAMSTIMWMGGYNINDRYRDQVGDHKDKGLDINDRYNDHVDCTDENE